MRDASKVALMALVDLMKTSNMSLLDVQWLTPHLESLGAVAIKISDGTSRALPAVTAAALKILGVDAKEIEENTYAPSLN